MARSLLAVSNLLDLPPCALQDGRAQMRSLSIIFSAVVLLLLGSASAQQPDGLPHRPWLPSRRGSARPRQSLLWKEFLRKATAFFAKELT